MDQPSSEVKRETRERKKPTFFQSEDLKTEKKAIVPSEGNGIKLGDYPYFCKEIEKLRGDDEVLKALHSLMFNTAGRKLEVKKNIRKFSGFGATTNKETLTNKLMDKKKVWTVTVLKSALGIFGLEKSGDRDALITRLIEYLEKPSELKSESAASSKKRVRSKSTSSSSKKRKTAGAKKEKKKGAPSAFILYSTSIRAGIKEENPDMTFGELAKVIGTKWKELPDGERKKWQDEAAAVGAALKNQQEAEEEEEDPLADDDDDDGAEEDDFKIDEDDDGDVEVEEKEEVVEEEEKEV